MRLGHNLVTGIGLLVSTLSNKNVYGQYQYFDEHDRTFFNATTFLFGAHFNKFEPQFNALNYRLLEETSVYNFAGTLVADSTNFVRRSNFFGLGFNSNNIQFLISGGFRRSNPLRIFNFGFGLGFNQVLHFSYETGQPKVWFEGLLNYNYINSKIRLASFDITQPPMAYFNGTQFPDIPEVVGGKYHLSIDANHHIVEPVLALNFALTKSLGLRFAAGYSLLRFSSDPKLALRFRPDPAETSTNARADKLIFENTLEQINLDDKVMDRYPLDLKRWNFNVSLVLRMFPEKEASTRQEFY